MADKTTAVEGTEARPVKVDKTGLAEAPVSVTAKVIFRGYDTLLTIRGWTGGATMIELDTALTWLEDNGGGPTLTRPAHAAPPPAGPQMLAMGHATGPAGEAGGVIAAEWYIVKPETGGKARVEFWRAGRDWPEIQAVKAADRLPDFLAGLPSDFGEHRVPVAVTWTQGKPKANGNGHYQDIVGVKRAA